MRLWQKETDLLITRFLRVGKDATVKVAISDTVSHNVTPAQVAALSGDSSSSLGTLNVNLPSVGTGGIETGLTAHAGGGQTSALALSATKSVHEVTTVASAADSVKLPAATGSGNIHIVKNSAAANSMQLFGSGTDTIDGVATGTGVAVAAGKGRFLVDADSGNWISVAGA